MRVGYGNYPPSIGAIYPYGTLQEEVADIRKHGMTPTEKWIILVGSLPLIFIMSKILPEVPGMVRYYRNERHYRKKYGTY